MSIEAMKQALGMLNEIADDVYCDQKLEGVITALRQALVDADDTSQEQQEYERGFIDGMQHQMQLSVKINKEPTKIFGPGLEEILNSAGFYRKREWVGLTDEERRQILLDDPIDWIVAIESKLKEKNT